MKTDTLRNRIERICVSALGFGALVISASLASGQLPDEILNTSARLKPAQRETVVSFVDEQIDLLESTDPRKAADGTRRLTSSLDVRDSSRTFRLDYAEILAPKLAEVVKNEEAPMHSRITAIQLLGMAATDASSLALQEPLKSDVDAIRYAAAMAIEETLKRMQADVGMFQNARQRELELTRWLRDAASSESNHLPLHAEFAALAAAPTANDAVLGITQSLEEQFRAALDQESDGRIGRYREGLQLALNRYVKTVGVGSSSDLQRALVRASIMAIHFALNQAPQAEERRVQQLNDLIGTAENSLSVLTGQRESITAVGEPFKNGEFDEAASQLEQQWLTADGPIYSNATWGFKPGELDRDAMVGG